MGPTVPGDVMAAGNLICASPPYLNNSRRELGKSREAEYFGMPECFFPTCYLPRAFKQRYRLPEEGSGGPL